MSGTTRMAGIATGLAAALSLTGLTPALAATARTAGDGGSAVLAAAPKAPAKEQTGASDTDKITLITGDQVWLTRARDAGGKASLSARIVPAPRPGARKVSFAQWGTSDHYYVVPTDVLPLLGTRVDRRIFDVAGLIDSGASDSSETRVILTFGGRAAASSSALDASARAVTARAKIDNGRLLPSANALALRVPAGRASGLFAAVGQATSGATFVSLDAPVKAFDATSTPQVGAPKAWKAGYTGKGIKVAILDTGIEATHPDLKGQVLAAKDFSGSGSATDRVGHGTHVASIIAGTGAASDPGMRGVAYQAKLLNAKVLGDYGQGFQSDVIEGMEWAAKSGADVINMSLGGGPGDGIDPTERSVNALAKKYGIVFAIAAGNGGEQSPGGVSSPSTADAAISVAAVDSRNKHASFSDTGPRARDGALKPDVAAPGVGILGARSTVNMWGSGTSPYVRLSGTSMATPHVAGAAALLAQARPDLSGSELKSALMGGATKRAGTLWEDGTGTINIPGSIGMPVIAREGSLSFGIFEYPQSSAKPMTKTIHYRNTTNKPLTLKLDSAVTNVRGRRVPGVSLSDTSPTVPANGTVAVRVTVSPKANPVGVYGGAITATPDTGHQIRTTVGWTNDVRRFDVTLKALDHAGAPARAETTVFTVDKGPRTSAQRTFKGTTTLRLAAGTYSALGVLMPTSPRATDAILAAEPQFTVPGATTVTLGGPRSRRMTVKTPKPSTLAWTALTYQRGNSAGTESFQVGVGGPGPQTWATPTRASNVGTSWFAAGASLNGPGRDPAYDYQLGYLSPGRVPASLDYTVTPREVAASIGTYRSRMPGAMAFSGWRPIFRQGAPGGQAMAQIKLPTTATTYLVGKGARWEQLVDGPASGMAAGDSWTTRRPRAYPPGSTTRTDYFSGVTSPGAVASGRAFRTRNRLVATFPLYEDSAGRVAFELLTPAKNSLTADVDGKPVVAVPTGTFNIAKPTGKTLHLVQRVQRKEPWWWTSTSSTGEWTVPLSGNQRVLPLMNVNYRLPTQSMTGQVPPGEQSIGLSVSSFIRSRDFASKTIAATSLRLDWSVDGGKTWRPATVKRMGKAATATFTPPTPSKGTSTIVSLRASASDAKGSTVKETVIAAYEMSGLVPGPIAPRR